MFGSHPEYVRYTLFLFRQDPKALVGQVRRLLELARPQSALIGGAMGLLLGTTAISLAVPKVMGNLIDHETPGAAGRVLRLADKSLELADPLLRRTKAS